ncbi:hypothetical protein PFICI_04322 [Pestalotiopsis fici W106-1]|uniref:Protein kinase domain-containing protein n=1 Tax=Pestalotiopsis fici (strain W106-1 / CGMCC3.15140) TaxID=1229662 RepID=W3XB81_PESFW|nr:uncharacterized protein PFICI_04322 [Pestalotiopsis fici W106-1]ETS82446.1 hypothetical protein PFICI_04322 [Pestalotiopsis fici W106-1]
MSDLEGSEAARLFVEYAEENKCNNTELLRRLENATKRDPSIELTGDTKKDLLPTREKLERVLGPNDTVLSLLCCTCKLCQRGSGFRELARNTRILEDAKKRKELAVLILSGCLFALGDLCTQADFKVVRFAAQSIAPWSQQPTDSSCFSRIAPIPSQCPHTFFDKEDFSFPRIRDLCLACRKRVFQSAALEKSNILNIPRLQRSSAPVIFDHSTQNLPFIFECPQTRLNTRLTPQFYTSQIEPSCCEDEQLRDQVLFRKVFKYQHERSDLISEAAKEALIAMHLARRDNESFVEVLFALTYKDRFYTYVEIVFPFYDRDLGHEFELRKLGSHLSTPGCLLDNPLWKASLDVVRAVCIMHDAIDKMEVECSGHFDIKPENIVIKEDKNGVMKLFLIDFGQAAAHRAGTNLYQPPEVTRPRSNTNPFTFAYDVWSMACVLLEVLVFIEFGLSELRLFRSRVRGNDEDEYAFWQGTSPHDMVLRPAVTGRLQTLEDQGDQRTRAAIRQLRAMLSIFPDQRPTMRSCLGEFQRINLNRQDLGLPTQDWMNCGLERWKTSYSTSRMARPNPGNIYFFRDKPGQIQADERITLDIESVIKETKAVKTVTFIPHAFFNPSTNPGHTFACHFDNLHEGFTFHFSSLDKFLEFMSLLTYQRIVPDISEDPNATGTRFKLNTCQVKIYGWPSDQTRKFKGGTVQIWRQLSQSSYDRYHKRSESLSSTSSTTGSGTGSSEGAGSGASTTGVNGVRHSTNAWKLAIWTHDAKTEERTCVVVDIGAKTWRLEDPTGQRVPQRLKIKPHYGHADFRGAIFTPSTARQNGNGPDDRYPGFPIGPIDLQTKMRSRLTEVTIDFLDNTHRSQILHIFRNNKFNLPG